MASFRRFYWIIILVLVHFILIRNVFDNSRSSDNVRSGKANNEGEIVVNHLVQSLVQASRGPENDGGISEQDAIDIGEIIQRVSTDPELSQTLSLVTQPDGKDTINAIREDMEPKVIVLELTDCTQEIKAIEELFSNGQSNTAYEKMLQKGLIPQGRELEYKYNTKLLKDDMMKQMYFEFLTLAAAGGYL